MDRRRFLIGAGSAAIGGSALLGSGAFSRVESQRGVAINVAEDPDAYVGLDRCPDSPNQSYIDFDKGHLQIDMSKSNPTDDGGEGVNSDSRTWFDRVFQICNQGKEKACVWIEDDDDWPMYDDEERRVEFYREQQPMVSLIGQENAIGLATGDCVCVGIRTTTKSLSEGDELLEDLGNEITIIADVDEDCPQPTPVEEYEAFQVDLAWGDPLTFIDSENDVTYSSQERLMAWQHGDGNADESPDFNVWAGQNGNRFDDGGSTLGFDRLFEELIAIRLLDENGNVVTTTDGNLNVSRGTGGSTPVEAEIEYELASDEEESLSDKAEALYNEIYPAGNPNEERALDALYDEDEDEYGLQVTWTAYGGDDFGWNPPELQVLWSESTMFYDNGTKIMNVDLPDLG